MSCTPGNRNFRSLRGRKTRGETWKIHGPFTENSRSIPEAFDGDFRKRRLNLRCFGRKFSTAQAPGTVFLSKSPCQERVEAPIFISKGGCGTPWPGTVVCTWSRYERQALEGTRGRREQVRGAPWRVSHENGDRGVTPVAHRPVPPAWLSPHPAKLRVQTI